ncbi:astacin [Dictyocaulus viviparus]|uniref:Zinc metalloproteinase n=1 Tax=Dictyocaulus viviparus TaxID=29172 RepID=A0A0D8Y2I0_DICVI|nr:astacin [Dictyocaulus viviparus]
MKIFFLLILCVVTILSDSTKWSNQRSNNNDSTTEEKIERGYQLLKEEAHAADTKAFLLKLHDVEQGRETELDQQYANFLDDMKRFLEIEFNDVKQMGDAIATINKKSHVDTALYQGDIMLTKEQGEQIIKDIEQSNRNRLKRQAYHHMSFPTRLWSDGVSYTFHNASDVAIEAFRRAVEIWQNVTCIRFTENSTAVDKIVLINGTGCWSELGKIGGNQSLSLGDGCEEVGTAVHEIGHALGFFHTHSRYDRDDFISIQWRNVEKEWKTQFDKENNKTNNNYGLTYDYGSVMHYGARSGTKNGRPTMLPLKDMKYILTIGSDVLAFYDMMMMNLHYGCLGNNMARNTSIISSYHFFISFSNSLTIDRCGGVCSSKCANGGIPHPRNCSKCLCPSGYAGDLCTERPSTGCGATLTANSTEQTLTVTMGDNKSPILKDEFDVCHYWLQVHRCSYDGQDFRSQLLSLKGPTNSRIIVFIVGYWGITAEGCKYGGVEIKVGEDKRTTGYRICSKKYARVTLTSKHSTVPVMVFNRYRNTTVTLRYRTGTILICAKKL